MSHSAAFLAPLLGHHPRKTRLASKKCGKSSPARRIQATASSASPPKEPVPEQPPASDTTLDVETRPVPLQGLKSDLYLLLSSSSLGFSVPESQRSQILSIITSLESRNPTVDTSYSPLLPGQWRLLYTTARDVLSLSLLSPFVNVAQVYQTIEPGPGDEFDVENIVYFRPPFAPLIDTGTEGVLRVEAKAVVKGSDRIDLTFKKALIRQAALGGVEIPESLRLEVPISGPVGYLDTTFLDEDLRIGRAPMIGNRDNIFVLAREE